MDARNEGNVLGTLHLTDSSDPGLLARNYENTNCDPEVQQEVRKTLFAAGFEEFRRRGHRQATLLLDYDENVYERLAELKRYGLGHPVPYSGYVRPLQAEDPLLLADADVLNGAFVQARPYNPKTDFTRFTSHLFNADALGHMDTKTLLYGYVQREPTSIVVATEVATERIVGSIRIPHGPIPLIDNLTIEPHFSNPEVVETALHYFAFDALRKRGMKQVEKIGIPGLPCHEYGFTEAWPLIRVAKLLA